MNVICLNPQSDPLWCRLAEAYASSVFHSPAWLRVLAATYGLNVQAYVLLDDAGQPVAGLPFCQVADIRDARTVSMPFSDYCDPLVRNRQQWDCLVEPLLSDGCPVTVRCVHNDIPLSDGRFEQVNRARWHGLDLTPSLETLWDGLHGSARRAIRKAQQSEIVVEPAQTQKELRAFFELHLGIRKYKYRLLAQPYRFFEQIWQQFVDTQNGLLLLARLHKEIIGGVLFLEWQNRLYYKFNASSPDSLGYRPNDLLIWEGINYAKRRDYTHLDFGLSDWDQAGLLQYKRKFASAEKTIAFMRCNTNQPATEQARQAQRLLPQLTALFTEESVPDAVTEKAGDLLYRYFI